MRIWPYRIRLPTFFHKIFPSSDHIPPFWPRNCSPTAPPLSNPNNRKTVLTMALLLISLLAISLAYKWTQKGLEWAEYGI